MCHCHTHFAHSFLSKKYNGTRGDFGVDDYRGCYSAFVDFIEGLAELVWKDGTIPQPAEKVSITAFTEIQ